MRNRYDDEWYVRIMQKLQVKHDDLFEKIVFAQRDDKQEIAQAYAFQINEVRAEINTRQHMYLKMKWGDMYRNKHYF